MTQTLKRNLAAFALTAAVLGAGAVAAFAETGGGTAASEGQPAPRERAHGPGTGPHGPGKRGLHGAVHGDLVVPNPAGGFHTVQLDRGTLEAREGNRLTVKRPDGPTVAVTVDEQTRYRGVEGAAQLQTGRPVVVVSKEGTALVVGQPPEGGERRRGRGPGRP